MIYSTLFQKKTYRIPTFLGIFFVGLITIVFISLFSNFSKTSIASKVLVKRVELVNLLPSQATIYWQTENKETGLVIYGTNEKMLNFSASDVRDVNLSKNKYSNHFVNLKNLQPNQKYYYKILSDNKIVSNNNQFFNFKTPDLSQMSSGLNPIYGTVIGFNGKPLEGATVLVTVKDCFILAAQTKAKGEWLLPIINVYYKADLKQKTLGLNDMLKIEIISEDSQASFISSSVKNSSPLPQTVIIGKNYDFYEEPSVLAASTDKFGSIEIKNKVDILYPKENAVIAGGKPLVKGVAYPGKDVVISINSQNSFSTKTKADENGLWQVVLDKDLTPGQYTITLTTSDQQEKNINLSRNFSIAKSGEQVLGEATPEPTITTTAPTNTPPIIATLAPTITSIPTVFTPTPTNPVTGANTLSLIISSASLIIIGIGLALAF